MKEQKEEILMSSCKKVEEEWDHEDLLSESQSVSHSLSTSKQQNQPITEKELLHQKFEELDQQLALEMRSLSQSLNSQVSSKDEIS